MSALAILPEELINTLNHSSLATVLVEGSTDVSVYRYLEREFENAGIKVDVLPCGGRGNLLKVFDRRGEITRNVVVFLADRDSWVFTGVPPQYADIVFTAGYSIENDLIAGGDLETLLDTAERATYDLIIRGLCEWFAYELDLMAKGVDPIFERHAKQILDTSSYAISQRIIAERGYTPPPPLITSKLVATYWLSLRGKQVFDALLMLLSDSARRSKYSRHNLIELCARKPGHLFLWRIIQRMAQSFALSGPGPA
jgi:hypothetical protein